MSLYDLVSGQMDKCQQYAEEALTDAQDYLDTLLAQVVEPYIPVDDIVYEWPEPNLDAGTVYRPDAPDLSIQDRVEPDDVTLEDIDFPDMPTIPSFNEEMPSISWPDKPSGDLPDEPGDAPSVSDVIIPSAPTYELPDVPTLDTISLPGSPDILFPIFDAALPDSDLVPPENGFIYNEEWYQSELGDVLRDKILGYLASGGTGLGAEVENAIWNQARLRTESENDRLYNEALNFWSARGWTRPPGALDARLYEVSVERSRALADVNEKILIEQARLAYEMEKFIVQAGLEREKMVIDYTNQAHARAFEAAKAAQEYALKTFEGKVLWYNAQMEAYKTEAQVYAARIQAELGKVEAYKAQLDAAKTHIAIQQGEIQLYLAQLQGVTTIIELYKSQLQAAALSAEINKVRLELFRLQVESYHVQVQAKVAQYDLYKAQLSGEQIKVQTFSEQAKAYAIVIDGLKTEIEAKKAEVSVKAEVNKDRIQSMLGKIERFKALRAVDMESVKALIQRYEVQERIYGDDIKLVEADLKAQTDIYHGNLAKAKNQTDLLLKEAEMHLQNYLQNRNLAIEAAKAGANVCAQLAASSLSAVHAGANIGYSGSESTGVSESRSTSVSTQTVYQHNYQES